MATKKKARVFKCRWCQQRSGEKGAHFAHIKTHLDPKKMLACTMCPFVTEYKHHWEYHERNHTGVKPFKCDQCDYQCVNMSMLKSHMRSHSSEFPYECTVCQYSVKYKHSLNQHMKKYHQNKELDHIYREVFTSKHSATAASSAAVSHRSDPDVGASSSSGCSPSSSVGGATTAGHLGAIAAISTAFSFTNPSPADLTPPTTATPTSPTNTLTPTSCSPPAAAGQEPAHPTPSAILPQSLPPQPPPRPLPQASPLVQIASIAQQQLSVSPTQQAAQSAIFSPFQAAAQFEEAPLRLGRPCCTPAPKRRRDEPCGGGVLLDLRVGSKLLSRSS